MSRLVIDIKQRFGITCEAGIAAIDGLAVDTLAKQRVFVVTAGENGLDGAIGRTGVGERAKTGRFQPGCPIRGSESEDALGAT